MLYQWVKAEYSRPSSTELLWSLSLWLGIYICCDHRVLLVYVRQSLETCDILKEHTVVDIYAKRYWDNYDPKSYHCSSTDSVVLDVAATFCIIINIVTQVLPFICSKSHLQMSIAVQP